MSNYEKGSGRVLPGFLILLFFVEMWERFSYYGMRALLVLFLTSYIGFEDKNAYLVYSLFAAISYAFPILGGLLADKLMGFRSMVLIGGIVITFGHIAMALSENNTYLIFLGLSLIGVGTGLFKGNITNLLGACYKEGDPRRSQGFTLFYVGVNIGGFIAAVACGYVANIFGWHYGFGLAGVGMIFGMILFIKFQNILDDIGLSPRPDLINKNFMGLKPFWLVFIGSILAAALCAEALSHGGLFVNALKYFGVLILTFYLYLVYSSEPNLRPNLYVIAIMIIFLMIFFALEMQLGSLINLFTERNIEKEIFGISVPAAVSQAINPVAVIVTGFILSIVVSMSKLLDVLRIFLSIVAMAVCFFILYAGCLSAGEDGQINYLFLVVSISLMSLGEIFIAPVVQSYVSLLAPDKYKGLIVGMMMLSLAFSNLAGIVIAEFMAVPSIGGNVDVLQSLEIYKAGFWDIAVFHIYLAVAFIPFGIYVYRVLKRA